MCDTRFFSWSAPPVPDPLTQNRDVSLAEKLAFLHQASAYGNHSAHVASLETHMSWVFLTDTLVYKLKKPVRFDFLDFSTLESRRRNCEQEIQVNRRLAPDVYLGLVPLTQRSDGQLQLGGSGNVVDYLVKMRRLPAQRMLDAAIRSGTAEAADMRRLGDVLGAFYQRAERVAVAPDAYCRHIEQGILENRDHLQNPVYDLDRQEIEWLTQVQLDFAARHHALLAQRAREQRIVDAHGDLRPEHICLLPEPVIIDSLEFRREFRIQDPVDELAYLALECERLGNGAIGEQLLDHYQRITGDTPDQALIAFYKTFRACLRAKIAVWHLADPALDIPERWRQRAGVYLALAGRHAKKC